MRYREPFPLPRVHRAGEAVDLVQRCADCGETLINREGEAALDGEGGGRLIFWSVDTLVIKDSAHQEQATAAEAQAFRCTKARIAT